MSIQADFSDLLGIAADFAVAAAAVTPVATTTVKQTADQVLTSAQGLAPVLTGELRASGHVVGAGLTAEVVFDSEHALYVEYGTNDTPPQPYLNPAFDLHERGFAEALADAAGGLF